MQKKLSTAGFLEFKHLETISCAKWQNFDFGSSGLGKYQFIQHAFLRRCSFSVLPLVIRTTKIIIAWERRNYNKFIFGSIPKEHEKNRIVYKVVEGNTTILSCRDHYDDK